MSYCPKCRVEVAGSFPRCPLCHGLVEKRPEGHPVGDIYPPVSSLKRPTHDLRTFFKRLILFCSIVGIGACILVNILTWRGFAWSAIAAVGCLTLDVLLYVVLFSRANLAKRIVWMVIPVVATVLTVEYTTGTHVWHWGLDYVVPFVLIGFTTALNLMAVIRYFRWNNYALYILLLAILGLVPLILVMTPLVTVWWPSVVSAGYSVVTLVGLFVFSRQRVIDLLHRKFHL